MIRSTPLSAIVLLGLACTGTIEDRPGSTGSKSGPGGSGGTGGAETPEVTASCKGAAASPARLWRLTHLQVKNTIAETFGFTVPVLDTFPAEARLDGYANASERLGLSPVLVEYYHRAAEDVATEVVRRGPEVLKCPLTQASCLTDFIKTFGLKAWRRPLSEVEVGKLVKLYADTTAAGPDVGLKTVVKGLLMSASFLFRTELGTDRTPGAVTTLTDFELASALSYMFWDAPPDAALLELAAAGKLHQPATLKEQAQRMFSTSAKGRTALHSFMQQWLETEELPAKQKDPKVFPMFDAQVARDLEEETRLFVNGVVFDPAGDRTLRTLLTASYGYVNSRTAPLYGATGSAALARAALNPAERRGLLTQASFLASHAEPANTSVVGRGRYIREQVLCSPVPPPPGDFVFNEKIITEDMTAREKFKVHSANPSCASCHALFDVIGFALENYDAVGQYRKTEKGKVIDPSGALPLPNGDEIQFENFVDLIDQLANGKDAYACFASQYLQYATGKVKLSDCEKEEIGRAFEASGYRLDALATAVVTSPRFITRQN